MGNVYEHARLDALQKLNLLDTPPSENFDRITRMAGQIFNLPIAAVSLTDQDRQWFKSRVGVEHRSIPRERAPCSRVAESAEVLVIPDLLADECYRTSILAKQGVRFYAGAPLITRDGFGLGALCVLGTEPRQVSDAELAALGDLAKIVMTQIELQHAYGRVDPITGLPNRLQFLDDLDDLGRDQPGQARIAVVLDLARAEQLDAGVRVMGAGYIDELVRAAARKLRSAIGPGRTAYHIGTTQFACLAPVGACTDAYAAELEDKTRRAHASSDDRFVLNATIGVAPFVAGRTSSDDVIRTAHSAALDARSSKTSVGVYSRSGDDAHRRRFRLHQDFGEALEGSGQLRLVIQPQVDLSTGRCVGAEALLRWKHPVLGEVSPGEFIPIVEQTALARATTDWVLNCGLAHLGAWRTLGTDIKLSINVSATNLMEDDFAERVALYLLKHRVLPGSLELEVTESAVMENAAQALDQLTRLEEAGISLAIDDFGTGYSSFSYLQRLPAQVVKIDQSFVRDLADAPREQTLVSSMISLSHGLGYRVVAEGVETQEVAELLSAMGCDEGQGYYFARPMEVADFERWLDRDAAMRAAA
jgi:EAL domain-containing protein (putative c-di-GMP-specific phosphodiesterase class I)/GAF domain-containing protein